jgi:phosphodiesterase/alkaline phosphatase D-like protein
LLGLLSSSTFFFTLSSSRMLSAQLPEDSAALDFPQGVASGDPQPDGVMLWTRAVPRHATDKPVKLLLQLSGDRDFSTILLQEQVGTGVDSDYTVRSYVDGLSADTQYFYRFIGGELDGEMSISRTGRTRTAPLQGQPRRVNLAFARRTAFTSCCIWGTLSMSKSGSNSPMAAQTHGPYRRFQMAWRMTRTDMRYRWLTTAISTRRI